MAWCNYADQQGLLLPALAGCALHELGHLAAIWGLGGSVRRLRLTAVGAEIQMERPMSYPGELAAALAGPAANLGGGLAVLAGRGRGPLRRAESGAGLLQSASSGQAGRGRALHCLLSMSIGPAAEEAEAVLDRVLIAFLLALGVLLIGWGGSFTLLLVALWLLAKEKEGKKGRNRSCQGLQKRVKWFLHSK